MADWTPVASDYYYIRLLNRFSYKWFVFIQGLAWISSFFNAKVPPSVLHLGCYTILCLKLAYLKPRHLRV